MENQNYKGSTPNSPTTEDVVDTPVIDEMDEDAAAKEHLTSSDDPTKVKFISANSEYTRKNGEAKVDIENVQRSVGMGKEELMKYANDPFWVRLRMTLFVLFWVVWVAMLVGSVVIIILAPRCPPPPQLDWWQKTAVYQVLVGSYKDSNGDGRGDLQGLTSKLDYLDKTKLKTLLLGSIFQSEDASYGSEITNFMEIAPEVGTMQDFNDLVVEMENKEMKLLLELVPNHSSKKHDWFQKSVRKIDPYTDYYVWADGKTPGSESEPPSNWLSVHSESAWSWNAERKQYYLSQFFAEQPDLNLRNPAVRTEIKNIFLFWLGKGVDGFKISHLSHLVEDDSFTNEPKNLATQAAPAEYDRLSHIHTLNNPMNLELIREWRDLVDNYAAGNDTKSHKRILLTDDNTDSDALRALYYGNSSAPLLDLPFNSGFLHIPADGEAEYIRNVINASISTVPDGLWPNWVLGTPDTKRLASRVGPKILDGIHAISLLAKGTPILYYGDEIGMENVTIQDDLVIDPVALKKNEESRDAMRTPMQWDNTTQAGFTSSFKTILPVGKNYQSVNVLFESETRNSHLKFFEKLMELRSNPSIRFGTMDTKANSKNIFSMTRVRKGNPGYLVVVNFSKNDTMVDLKASHKQVPESGKVEMASFSPWPTALTDEGHPKINFAEVPIGSKQTLVLSFVPNAE